MHFMEYSLIKSVWQKYWSYRDQRSNMNFTITNYFYDRGQLKYFKLHFKKLYIEADTQFKML